MGIDGAVRSEDSKFFEGSWVLRRATCRAMCEARSKNVTVVVTIG